MDFIYGSHILGQFDVQVDSNNRYDTDRITEIDVYGLSLTNEGDHTTDTLSDALARREVPNLTGDCDDMWYGTENMEAEAIQDLPESVRTAFKEAVAEATAKQTTTAEFKYAVGDTVFITEHRFPADVEAHTVNGGYIVDMANTGELAEFAPDELEDYDRERWNRP